MTSENVMTTLVSRRPKREWTLKGRGKNKMRWNVSRAGWCFGRDLCDTLCEPHKWVTSCDLQYNMLRHRGPFFRGIILPRATVSERVVEVSSKVQDYAVSLSISSRLYFSIVSKLFCLHWEYANNANISFRLCDSDKLFIINAKRLFLNHNNSVIHCCHSSRWPRRFSFEYITTRCNSSRKPDVGGIFIISVVSEYT